MRLKICLLGLVAIAALGATSVRADGEAGLVIDWGDGTTTEHCVAFEGESISGEELLASADLDVNQFSGLVCGIDGVGCEHSGSFNSCTCECQDLGGDCAYWSFFSKSQGDEWAYSATGYQGEPAGDGAMHAWRWGEGGPSSAPAPDEVSFEQVCGVGADPTAGSATSTQLPASTQPPGASPTIDPLTDDDAGGGNGAGAFIAFGAVAGGLVVLAGAGWIWRARHGG